MSKRGPTMPGWTRIPSVEFKAAIAVAMETHPYLCQELRLAIKKTAARRDVEPGTVNQYLRWIAEVEQALLVIAGAEDLRRPAALVPAGQMMPALDGADRGR